MPSNKTLIDSAIPAGQGERQAQLDCVAPLAPLPFQSH